MKKEQLTECERKDIEHGRENCQDFAAYHVLSFLANAFPKDRYVDYPITLQAENLTALFTTLVHVLQNDIEAVCGRP